MEDPVRRACHILLWRVPLLLPLVVVVGTICGGSAGWVVAVMALAVAHVLKQWRLLLCSLLCGAIVALTQFARQNSAEELETLLASKGAVSLQGVVVRELAHGCILETHWLGLRVVLRGNTPWHTADEVRVTAERRAISPPPVEGMFSYENWMRGQGICANMTCLHGEKVGEAWGISRLALISAQVRERLARILMPPGSEADPRCQTLCALALGEKELTDAETLETFRRGGCLHAFAVSGLHVGLVSGIIWALLRLLRVPPAAGRYVLLAVVGAYVAATGLAVSALRAYLMLAALLGGLMLRRRVSIFNTWCFAALLILMIQPWQLYQAGFLLSFVVYGAICLGATYSMGDRPWFGPDSYIPKRIRTWRERKIAAAELALRGLVVVSLCAWLVSLPVMISRFHVVNVASYLTNIAISPLLPLVMSTALAAIVFNPLPLLGPACHSLATHTAGWLISLVGAASTYPGAFLPAQPPAAPGKAMAVCLGYGKSFCVLGNPGILVGDLRAEGDARYTIEPALFHAGFTPVALCGDPGKALSIYRRSWPSIRTVVAQAGAAPISFCNDAGEFTLYFPPAGISPAAESSAQPIILWRRPQGDRVLYIGNAPMTTLEAMPPEARMADIIILGYNAKEPLLEPEALRKTGAGLIILLPSALKWRITEHDVAPAKLQRLSPEGESACIYIDK